jgi:hypothetical protein
MSEYNYDDLPEVRGEIINWDNVGQEICGTYVGKSAPINTKYGQNFLYEIMEDDGNIKKCWARKNITDVMKLFKLGVRVKIKFVAAIPSKKGNDFKDIKVFGNAKVVNEEWVAQQNSGSVTAEEAEEIMNGPEEEVKIEDVEEDKTEAPFLSESEKKKMIIQITELATSKLGATDGEDVKNKVMEATELAFIDSNLEKIAEALSVLPERK